MGKLPGPQQQPNGKAQHAHEMTTKTVLTSTTPKPSRSIFIADAKGGNIWRPLDHTRIVAGHTTKGYVCVGFEMCVYPVAMW
jgi:hypothetical protein